MSDLSRLKKLAVNTLDKLVTNDGIYASSSMGQEGLFHGFFGRDTAITAYLISQAESLEQNPFFLWKAVKGLVQLKKWQSITDNPQTGAEFGKFPHEVRLHPDDYRHLTVDLEKKGERPWYVDPQDKVMKNWDNNDATQLWIITIGRMHEKGMVEMDEELLRTIKNGLRWCIRNMQDHEGFAGYRYNPDRPWAGLFNQNWKDSQGAYLYADGKRANFWIKDVFASALTWCAMKYGYKLFLDKDTQFAQRLKEESSALKERFNNMDWGFLIEDEKSVFYYAEALDGEGHKLTGVSCDPGLALWAYFEDECIISEDYIPAVVKRIFESDMFDSEAGLRTYSCEGSVFDPIGYHRGPHTFWPFVSALTADGLNHFGYHRESRDLLQSMVNGIKKFDTCVELFVKKENKYERFQHPFEKQLSCAEQAWTAGALYYATNFIEKS